MTELQERLIKTETVIPFKAMDDAPGGSNLGLAEFEVCPKFFRGKLKEFWVYPLQQRDATEFFHYVGFCSPWSGFGISSYEQLNHANVWKQLWCSEHKTVLSRLYVPLGAKFIRLDQYGISFLRTEW